MRHTLEELFEVRYGNIVDAAYKWDVDAIVNAAHPTLRRDEGISVDGVINQKLDELSGCKNCLQEIITSEWERQHKEDKSIIKCKRGDIFVTSGGELCKHIIHTVGPMSDKEDGWKGVYSSTRINVLKDCYKKITFEILRNVDIKRIAIPILSAGNYKFDFELAFKVAVSEVYNTLLEQKKKDEELFEFAALEKIYFVIDKKENFKSAQRVYNNYRKVFCNEKRITIFKTWQSQAQYLKEIQLYDSHRGYFSIAKLFRMFIVGIRFASLYTYLKDLFGKENWECRRQVIEFVVILKVLFPILALILLDQLSKPDWLSITVIIIVVYNLVDTVTYLLELIILADIQNPSANIIRSIIMLFFNYLEAVLDIATIGYVWLSENLTLLDILAFVLIGREISCVKDTVEYIGLSCLNSGVQFFFVSIAFGYFANHLRQRKFRTNQGEKNG